MSQDSSSLPCGRLIWQVPGHLDGTRLDKALVEAGQSAGYHWSRQQVQKFLAAGAVQSLKGIHKGIHREADYRVQVGQYFTVQPLPERVNFLQPEPMSLDILFEDDDILVVNKPPDLVVHPGAGHREGTLVHGLLYYTRLSSIGSPDRAGIVHRLDKDTSGVMVVAKQDQAHRDLMTQLERRTVVREYEALVWGTPEPTSGQVESNIGRHPYLRQRMTAFDLGNARGKPAYTRYHSKCHFENIASLMFCRLGSGRTHQLRVHMCLIGHPIIGDPVYRGQRIGSSGRKSRGQTIVANLVKNHPSPKGLASLLHNFGRQALHARKLQFQHPRTGEMMTFIGERPNDFNHLITCLRRTYPCLTPSGPPPPREPTRNVARCVSVASQSVL